MQCEPCLTVLSPDSEDSLSRGGCHADCHTKPGVLPQVAEHCLKSAKDLSGLLLLYSARGSANGLATLTSAALEGGKNNVAFGAPFGTWTLDPGLRSQGLAGLTSGGGIGSPSFAALPPRALQLVLAHHNLRVSWQEAHLTLSRVVHSCPGED